MSPASGVGAAAGPARPIAVLAAMEPELAGLHERMGDARCLRLAGREVWTGTLGGRPVVATLSRIGKIAAATSATLLLQAFNAQALLLVGLAGALGHGTRRGDLVLATGLQQHDFDVWPLFPRAEVPFYGRSRFDADLEWLACARRAAQAVVAGRGTSASSSAQALLTPELPDSPQVSKLPQVPQVHEGLILTGDRFIADAAEVARLRAAHPQALAVEMEGAAMAQVAHDFGVPWAVLRTISDGADESAAEDFDAFLHRASDLSMAWLEALLQAALPGIDSPR